MQSEQSQWFAAAGNQIDLQRLLMSHLGLAELKAGWLWL
jgi:hypothetical protein